jgi:hypothetical protein
MNPLTELKQMERSAEDIAAKFKAMSAEWLTRALALEKRHHPDEARAREYASAYLKQAHGARSLAHKCSATRERLARPPLGQRVADHVAHWLADHLAVLETVTRFASSDSERALYRAQIETCQGLWRNVRAQCAVAGVAEELIASTSGLMALERRRRAFGAPKTAAQRLQLFTDSQARCKELLAYVHALILDATGARPPFDGNIYGDAVDSYSSSGESRRPRPVQKGRT